MVLLEFRPAQLLVLLCSATLLGRVSSEQTNSSDPVDPSNDVLPPGGDDDGVEAPPSTDALSNATNESNNEDNNVDPVDQPDMEEISGRVLPIALQTMVPRLTSGRSPVYPEHPPSPPSYGASHPFPGLSSTPDYGVKTFQCTFEDHTCGMRNQKNIGPNFKRVTNSIADRQGSYMAVDAASVGYGVSRLITPYLPGHPNAVTCLQLTYIVNGPGAERIEVVAQDTGNRHLFMLQNHGPVWRTFGINMTVTQDVRFFIEAYTNRHPGVIAVDDFTYSFDPCPPRFRP